MRCCCPCCFLTIKKREKKIEIATRESNQSGVCVRPTVQDDLSHVKNDSTQLDVKGAQLSRELSGGSLLNT